MTSQPWLSYLGRPTRSLCPRDGGTSRELLLDPRQSEHEEPVVARSAPRQDSLAERKIDWRRAPVGSL